MEFVSVVVCGKNIKHLGNEGKYLGGILQYPVIIKYSTVVV